MKHKYKVGDVVWIDWAGLELKFAPAGYVGPAKVVRGVDNITLTYMVKVPLCDEPVYASEAYMSDYEA